MGGRAAAMGMEGFSGALGAMGFGTGEMLRRREDLEMANDAAAAMAAGQAKAAGADRVRDAVKSADAKPEGGKGRDEPATGGGGGGK